MPRRKKTVNQVFIDFEDFKKGLYALEDTTKSPFGTARVMRNIQVTDRGGISPRPGIELLGTKNTSSAPSNGLYNFRKSFDTDEFLFKPYDDELEVYSKNHSSAGWWRLKDGYTLAKEFGFVTSLVNTDNEDYVIFNNRFENYQRWNGAVTLLDGALSGSETEVGVDSVLTDEIFESKTAVSASATTVVVLDITWAASQWIGMYVYITSGIHINKIRKITANTSTELTFSTLGTSPGTATFQIRKTAFADTGKIIYNGTEITYTQLVKHNEFAVSSAHAGSDNDAVAAVVIDYPANPKGNRLTNYLNRIIVGNIRSGMARDSGGALQGYSVGGSVFVSKISNPVDFTFSAARLSGEGDIIGTPYGGGEVTDVSHQEDTAYIFKEQYIESLKYSQDANDLAVRVPLKTGVGSVGPTIKGSDDIYFITADKKFTSIGRILNKDLKPHTENIGFKIKRTLDGFEFGTGRGREFQDKIFIPARSDSDRTSNDVVLVYNKNTNSFWGIWDISANYIEIFDKKLYFSDSNSPNVYQMLTTSFADVEGGNRFAIDAEYATHFFSLASTQGNQQALNSLYFEGYIKGDSVITFKAFKDFASDPFLQFDFSATETGLLDGKEFSASLGSESLALKPLGSVGESSADGRRHFLFTVYFPFQYANHFSVGFGSSKVDYDWEISRFGMGLKETISTDISRVKSI